MNDKEYRIIEDYWPLVICCTPVETNLEETDRYCKKMSALYERGTPMAWLNYVPRGIKNDRPSTRRIGEYMRETKEVGRELNAAIAYVSESTVLRFMIAGWVLMQPMTAPYACFPQMSEALAWLKATVRGKLELPAQLSATALDFAALSRA